MCSYVICCSLLLAQLYRILFYLACNNVNLNWTNNICTCSGLILTFDYLHLCLCVWLFPLGEFNLRLRKKTLIPRSGFILYSTQKAFFADHQRSRPDLVMFPTVNWSEFWTFWLPFVSSSSASSSRGDFLKLFRFTPQSPYNGKSFERPLLFSNFTLSAVEYIREKNKKTKASLQLYFRLFLPRVIEHRFDLLRKFLPFRKE